VLAVVWVFEISLSRAALLAPVIVVCTIWLTNSKRLMLPGYTNSWFMNVILAVVGIIGLWATYGVIRGLIQLVGDLASGAVR
jgi:hypothetical protein